MNRYALLLLLLVGSRDLTKSSIRKVCLYCSVVIVMIAAGLVGVVQQWTWLTVLSAVACGYVVFRFVRLVVFHRIEKVTVKTPLSERGMFGDRGFSFLASNGNCYVCEDSQISICPITGSEVYVVCRCRCYADYRTFKVFLYEAWIPAQRQ